MQTFNFRIPLPDYYTSPLYATHRSAITSFLRYPTLFFSLLSTTLYGYVVFSYKERTWDYSDKDELLVEFIAFFLGTVVTIHHLLALLFTDTRRPLRRALTQFCAGAALLTCALLVIFKARLFRRCVWGREGVCRDMAYWHEMLYGAVFSAVVAVAGGWYVAWIAVCEGLAEEAAGAVVEGAERLLGEVRL